MYRDPRADPLRPSMSEPKPATPDHHHRTTHGQGGRPPPPPRPRLPPPLRRRRRPHHPPPGPPRGLLRILPPHRLRGTLPTPRPRLRGRGGPGQRQRPRRQRLRDRNGRELRERPHLHLSRPARPPRRRRRRHPSRSRRRAPPGAGLLRRTSQPPDLPQERPLRRTQLRIHLHRLRQRPRLDLRPPLRQRGLPAPGRRQHLQRGRAPPLSPRLRHLRHRLRRQAVGRRTFQRPGRSPGTEGTGPGRALRAQRPRGPLVRGETTAGGVGGFQRGGGQGARRYPRRRGRGEGVRGAPRISPIAKEVARPRTRGGGEAAGERLRPGAHGAEEQLLEHGSGVAHLPRRRGGGGGGGRKGPVRPGQKGGEDAVRAPGRSAGGAGGEGAGGGTAASG
mmetsp:Transcript_34478/g.79695  ORF Transcript_34478/g.79695 Transcript_34478/m.79695 type:complete len:391 (-) Transcript_34478:657-1829(-)